MWLNSVCVSAAFFHPSLEHRNKLHSANFLLTLSCVHYFKTCPDSLDVYYFKLHVIWTWKNEKLTLWVGPEDKRPSNMFIKNLNNDKKKWNYSEALMWTGSDFHLRYFWKHRCVMLSKTRTLCFIVRVVIDDHLSWLLHKELFCKKMQRRFDFFRASSIIYYLLIIIYYWSLLYSFLHRGLRAACRVCAVQPRVLPVKDDKTEPYNHIKMCLEIMGLAAARSVQEAHNSSVLRLATNISSDPSHAFHREHQLLPPTDVFKAPSTHFDAVKCMLYVMKMLCV